MKNTGKTIVNGREITSLPQLFQLFDIKNESTFRYWLAKKDWNKDAVKSRLHQQGRKSELEDDEKDDLKKFDKFNYSNKQVYL